jgi:hypothetical protein
MALKPAAIAQIGDEIELTRNSHTWQRASEPQPTVVSTVIHVQTYAPHTHPRSPIRPDYVARQVVTKDGSRWAGHPREGLYRGRDIVEYFPHGVSFEDPWAAPLSAHGALPEFTLVANDPEWPEGGKVLPPFTTYEEARRILSAHIDVYGLECCLVLDGHEI